MSREIKSVLAGFVLAGSALCCGGCRSDGQTTRIGYTYEGPILMEAAHEQAAKPGKSAAGSPQVSSAH